MLHIIVIDNFPFFYAYTVLAALLLHERFMRDLEAMW